MCKKKFLNDILTTIKYIFDFKIEKKMSKTDFFSFADTFFENLINDFDDYAIKYILKNYEKYGISYKQYKILKKFYENLEKYSEELNWDNAEEIFNNPKWHEIQAMAKEVLTAFHYPKEADSNKV
ncbi:MAG: hypothetical protein Tsb0015_12780 [Simkaniaceae bacterium]